MLETNMSRKILLIVIVGVGLSACAKPATPAIDPRVGTSHSPYQTIPAYVECGDCSLIVQ